MRFLWSMLCDKRGATAIEYSLIASIIGITLFIALGNYYELMNTMFGGISNDYLNATK